MIPVPRILAYEREGDASWQCRISRYECTFARGPFIRVMKSIGKKKEEREGEEKNGRTIEKKARRTSGGEVSRFFSPAFEIVLEVYTSRLTEKSSFRYLLKAIRHKTESTGPTRAPLPLSRSVR